jgi:uncharacterized protein with von Willebrand factor type A (vWA) domain
MKNSKKPYELSQASPALSSSMPFEAHFTEEEKQRIEAMGGLNKMIVVARQRLAVPTGSTSFP